MDANNKRFHHCQGMPYETPCCGRGSCDMSKYQIQQIDPKVYDILLSLLPLFQGLVYHLNNIDNTVSLNNAWSYNLCLVSHPNFTFSYFVFYFQATHKFNLWSCFYNDLDLGSFVFGLLKININGRRFFLNKEHRPKQLV